MELKQVDQNCWEIPKKGKMNVPGRIYASGSMIHRIQEDKSPEQVANVATLPGIVGYSYAMPDIHWGYGFPIGGVAAFDVEDGVISPGGVGYDINCGVRFVRTSLKEHQVRPKIKNVMESIFQVVPAGVGSSDAIKTLSNHELSEVLTEGSRWAVEQGYGKEEDLQFTEDGGCMENADPSVLSKRAFQRGKSQIGTLGSGNHFLELDVVDKIYDESVGEALNLARGQVIIQVHSGSRGLGYQICDDFVRNLVQVAEDYGIDLVDRQLACTPLDSPEGKQYMKSMACAANYAWVNRQVMMVLAVRELSRTLFGDPEEVFYDLIYDVCHNIAKIAKHQVNGENQKVVVHRKGATRSLPPGDPLLCDAYQEIGQPVLVPGDMGSSSYLLIGQPGARSRSFASACHGAGRTASRREMKERMEGVDLQEVMSDRGVYVRSKSYSGMAEEMPSAYKDVSEVVQTVEETGLARKVARVRPIGVIKG